METDLEQSDKILEMFPTSYLDFTLLSCSHFYNMKEP